MKPKHPGLTLQAYRDGEARHYVRRGEKHPSAKLDKDKVRAIRASTDTTAALAQQYGVSPKTIRDIRGYRTWAGA